MRQAIFLSCLLIFLFLIVKRVHRVLALIKIGQPDLTIYHLPTQLKQLVLVAFGQSKMTKKPFSAILHSLIYLSFLLVAFLFLETCIDGISATHHSFAFTGKPYLVFISLLEQLALLAALACIIFFLRRNLFKVKRLHGSDLGAKEHKDANTILALEFFSTILYLCHTATFIALKHPNISEVTPISNYLAQTFLTNTDQVTLFVMERIFWWLHILLIFYFTWYIFNSKHLHVFLAFPTVFFAKRSYGTLDNLPSVTAEVKAILGMEQQTNATTANFGAADVSDLKQSQLLGALTCTECGRCTEVCPAHITGKKLSPRHIMMATRDRLETINKDSSQPTLLDTIEEEALWACTSCMACVETCPLMINPMSIILDLRRYLVMELSQQPTTLEESFNNLETVGAPWKFNTSAREDWFKHVR